MISVVIPVYNVEQYLRQCVDSVLGQSGVELEVILVDDGSTDGSGLICDEYATKDARVQVEHKSNGGLSDARNAGTAVATGNWIFYLDSDDWLEKGALAELQSFAEQCDCDVVQCGHYYAYSDHLLYRNPAVGDHVFSRDEAMGELARQDIVKNFAWGKLYKAEIARKYSFPVGKFFEDSYWQYKVINETNSYGAMRTPMVYYRQHEESISGTSSLRSLDLLRGEEEMLTFYHQHYPQHLPTMVRTYWNNLFAYRMQQSGNEEVEQYYREAVERHRSVFAQYLSHEFTFKHRNNLKVLRAYNYLMRIKGFIIRKLTVKRGYLTKPLLYDKLRLHTGSI